MDFYKLPSKQTQWKAFLRKSGLNADSSLGGDDPSHSRISDASRRRNLGGEPRKEDLAGRRAVEVVFCKNSRSFSRLAWYSLILPLCCQGSESFGNRWAAGGILGNHRDSKRGAVQLVRTPAYHTGGRAGSSHVAPAISSCSDDTVRSKSFDIAHGRLAKEAAVLSVELTDTLVADFVSCARGVHAIHKHALPCPLQPQLLLVLQWAHRG